MKCFYKENALLEQALDTYFEQIRRYSVECCENSFSLILLGSMSRGEATWMQEPGNSPRLLSDIEFLLVYSPRFSPAQVAAAERDIAAMGNEVLGRYASELFHIDVSSISQDRISRLEKKLLIFDAKAYGKTVAGPDAVPLLPSVTIRNINLFDIRDILIHRAYAVISSGYSIREEDPEKYRYVLAKNSLDLMTVLLVEKGVLVSGFQNRLKVLLGLDVPDELKQYFNYCLSLKLMTDSPRTFSTEEMERIFFALMKDLRAGFRVRGCNVFSNVYSLLRRVAGIARRAIRKKHFPSGDYFQRIYNRLISFQPLSEGDRRDQYILLGYPE